jgi:protein-S-isoprenylcysteine O-methyltransferase Ste14
MINQRGKLPMKLLLNALIKFIIGVALIGLMLFLPAGTLDYFGAWLFMGVLFVPVLIMGVIMFVKAPALLEKRLNNKEKEKAQKGVVTLSGLMFPVGFVLSALDFRFGWSRVPFWLMIISAVIFLVGYGIFAEATRENAYLSRTVEIQEGQRVVSEGLYGIVRHPMYLATLLMFFPMPLILGSIWGLIPFALYPAIIVTRIINEENVLTEGLEGYVEYKKKVKYRLIPFVW